MTAVASISTRYSGEMRAFTSTMDLAVGAAVLFPARDIRDEHPGTHDVLRLSPCRGDHREDPGQDVTGLGYRVPGSYHFSVLSRRHGACHLDRLSDPDSTAVADHGLPWRP
jgi:hypothetical protein